MVTRHKQLMDAGGVSKLHLAVFQGKEDKVRRLLEKGCPDIDKGDKFGQTPLHIACHREGLLGCLKLLAAHEVNLKVLDANGNTALHSAAGAGATAAAEFLLGRGVSVGDRNKDGHTPMDICNDHCPTGKRRLMQMMLEGGAKVEEDRAAGGEATAGNSTTTPGSSNSNNNNNADFAAAAPPNNNGGGLFVENGRGEGAERGGATTAAGGGGGSAAWSSEASSAERGGQAKFHAGAGGGGGSVSPATVTSSAAADHKHAARHFGNSASSSRGDSPRSKAVAAGAALARGEHKAPLLTPRGGSATMAGLAKDGAAATGAASAAGIGEGPFTPRRSAKQASLQELHLAIFQGDTARVEHVVARGDLVTLNEADRHGQTPLHLACYKGSRVMARLLVEGGASLEAVDVNGNGVVHAAVCDSPAVLAILIDHGADVNVANNDGLTPKRLCELYCPPRLKERMLQLLKDATVAQAKAEVRREQLAEEQMSIEAVYHQLAMLRSKLAATAAARTEVTPSEAAEGAQTENALLTLVEANVRVVEGQRRALQDLESMAGRLERMFRRLHMRLDTLNPGEVSFS